jgi:hypothetical protein
MSQLVMDHNMLIVDCKTVFDLVLSETQEFYSDDDEDVEVSNNMLLINVLTIIGKNCTMQVSHIRLSGYVEVESKHTNSKK